jgi:hypothetical protein
MGSPRTGALPGRLLGLLLCMMSAPVLASGWLVERFVDPSDGRLDASKHLAESGGFLPVPILITEPAVGYGLGIAALFFHDPLAGKTEPGEEFEPNPERDGSLKPPSISALIAGATENDTWFAGAGHFGVWRDDTVRYAGLLMQAEVNMDFYGIGGGSGLLERRPLQFTSEATVLFQQLLFRLGASDLLAGVRYLYLDTGNTFRTSAVLPGLGLPDVAFDSTSAGLGLVLEYDGVDNRLSPGRGLKAGLQLIDHGEAWGGDNDFRTYRAFANYWFAPADRWTLGLRGDGTRLDGDAPFYQYPFIDMRGIPALRYQGEEVLLGEIEARYDLTPRWSLLGFAGVGRAESTGRRGEATTVNAQGLGFRYLIARRFGMRAGIDVGWGPEETAVYITVGSAWQR